MHKLAFSLLVIGGLNWLVLALFDWEIGQLFGGMDATVSVIIYIIIGVAALYEALTHARNCKSCKSTK